MADEREWKTGIYQKQEDYTEKSDEVLKQAELFVASGRTQEALDALLHMEKTARLVCNRGGVVTFYEVFV